MCGRVPRSRPCPKRRVGLRRCRAGICSFVTQSAFAAPRDEWSRAFSYAVAASVAASVVAAVGLGVWVVSLRQQNQVLVAERSELERRANRPTPASPLSPADSGGAASDLGRRLEAEEARSKALQSEIARLQREVTSGRQGPVLNVPILDPEPTDALRSGPPRQQSVEVPVTATMVVLILSSTVGDRGGDYGIDIRGADDRVIWQGTGLTKSPLNTFSLVLPQALVPAGDLRIRVYAVRGGQRTVVHEYSVRVVYR